MAAALAAEKVAGRSVHAADQRLAIVLSQFNSDVDQSVVPARLGAAILDVEEATHERLLAVIYHARCRAALSSALEAFESAHLTELEPPHRLEPRTADGSAMPMTGSSMVREFEVAHPPGSASAAVLAEATAITAAAEVQLAIELEAIANEATDKARHAANHAALRVARAAEAAREAQETAVALAAEALADAAARAAAEVQGRADDAAALTAAVTAAQVISAEALDSRRGRLDAIRVAEQATAAAQHMADETAVAAEIVARAVADAAAALAASAGVDAAATELAVLHAARAVRAIVAAAAVDVDDATTRAAVAAIAARKAAATREENNLRVALTVFD